MTALLVSVRTPGEAIAAARAGADRIDLKEPRAGALGALPMAAVAAIIEALRAERIRLPVSATVGDPDALSDRHLRKAVAALADLGVDDVKVGIAPDAGPGVFTALAALPVSIVPVLLADEGLADARVEYACAGPFRAVMVDTGDKRRGSLVHRVQHSVLARFVARLRHCGKASGLAGSLSLRDVDAIVALAPDFAGFRSAVTDGARDAALDARKVAALAGRLRGQSRSAASAERTLASSSLPTTSIR